MHWRVGAIGVPECWADFIPQVTLLGSNPIGVAYRRILHLLGSDKYSPLPAFISGDVGVGMSVTTYLQDCDGE